VEEQHQMVLARSKLKPFYARGNLHTRTKDAPTVANTGSMIFGVNVDYSDN